MGNRSRVLRRAELLTKLLSALQGLAGVVDSPLRGVGAVSALAASLRSLIVDRRAGTPLLLRMLEECSCEPSLRPPLLPTEDFRSKTLMDISQDLSIEDVLHQRVLLLNGRRYTVSDLITVFSNEVHGAHLGQRHGSLSDWLAMHQSEVTRFLLFVARLSLAEAYRRIYYWYGGYLACSAVLQQRNIDVNFNSVCSFYDADTFGGFELGLTNKGTIAAKLSNVYGRSDLVQPSIIVPSFSIQGIMMYVSCDGSFRLWLEFFVDEVDLPCVEIAANSVAMPILDRTNLGLHYDHSRGCDSGGSVKIGQVIGGVTRIERSTIHAIRDALKRDRHFDAKLLGFSPRSYMTNKFSYVDSAVLPPRYP